MWDLGGEMEYKIHNYILMSVLLTETTNPCVFLTLEQAFNIYRGGGSSSTDSAAFPQ